GRCTKHTSLARSRHHHAAAAARLVAEPPPRRRPATSRSVSAMAKTKPTAAGAAAADKKHNNKKKGKGNIKGRSGPAAVAMKARGAAAAGAERSNPFEAIWSRRKFDVLGKKRKGEERRTSRSRSDAIHKRENTLLKEFEQSAKSSVFHDRRIGERDETLPEYDKAILRQQREHM
uniref:Uncharacterized protein n=1 Tax=Aegilops tauschii subsp. strangulata TaxID=200361 RepID=A0A453L7S5_AEGTS